jgi:uncharacterized protein
MRRAVAFTFSLPIAILGGLIGLGGAEFRLPVLLGPLQFSPRQAVVLNLSVSLVTILTSLAGRSLTLSLESLEGYWPAIFSLAIGGTLAGFRGASLVQHLNEAVLERVLAALLFAIGSLLLVEAFVSSDVGGLIPKETLPQVVVVFAMGLCIGLISSLLGVAGGELLIPTLVFLFGLTVKPAGTASLMISLPTVATGVIRHLRAGMYADRAALREVVAPMTAGSIIGSLIGGLLVGVISVTALKLLLGIVLIVSAMRMVSAWFRRQPVQIADPRAIQ